MNTLVCNPKSRPASLASVFDQLFNEPFVFATPASVLPNTHDLTLPLDISEDATSLIVRANVPGFTKDQVNVEVHDGVLTVRAEKHEEHEQNDERYHRRERRFGEVTRSIRLPDYVQSDAIKAELKDGVLTLKLAKAEKSVPRKVRID